METQLLRLKGLCMRWCKWRSSMATKQGVPFILWSTTKLALPPTISMVVQVLIVRMLGKPRYRQSYTSTRMMWKRWFTPCTLRQPIGIGLKEMSLSICLVTESTDTMRETNHDLPSQNSTRPSPIIIIRETSMPKNSFLNV